MAKTNKASRRIIDKALVSIGLVATVALLAIGGMAWWAHSFTSSNVRNELAQQKIFFPEAGSEGLNALPEADRLAVTKYAGQQVLDGDQAKVFANNYIAVHLKNIAGGKTYSEVSAEALKDPTNPKLQGQANTLFKGETLRGLLLGDAYAFWTIGQIAKIAAVVALVGGVMMLVLVILGIRHLMLL